jgi:hypothetical protein
MTHPNLGDELLKATGVTIPPPEQQLKDVLARASRRMRRLTWLVVALWVLTILMAGFLFAFSWVSELFTWNTLASYRTKLEESTLQYKDQKPEQVALARTLHTQHFTSIAVGFLAVAVFVLSLLSLGTIILIHNARRVTLRQIALSLQTLSEQVQTLHSASIPTGPEK